MNFGFAPCLKCLYKTNKRGYLFADSLLDEAVSVASPASGGVVTVGSEAAGMHAVIFARGMVVRAEDVAVAGQKLKGEGIFALLKSGGKIGFPVSPCKPLYQSSVAIHIHRDGKRAADIGNYAAGRVFDIKVLRYRHFSREEGPALSDYAAAAEGEVLICHHKSGIR